jgi:hypothetical protein
VLASGFTADAAAIASEASSFWMIPLADAVPIVVPKLGLLSKTVNPSLDSTTLSPATSTVMVLLVSPAANVTVPVGSTPPMKSLADAEFVPRVPNADHVAMLIWDREPEREAVKV